MQAREIVKFIETRRVLITTDKQLRRNLANEFFKAGVPHQQDVSLGSYISMGTYGSADFLIGDTAVIVRLKGDAASLRKECARACKSEQVRSLVVVTKDATMSPKSSNHKPVLAAQVK